MLGNQLLSPLLLTAVAALTVVESNDFFTSVAGLEILLKTEQVLLQDMTKYVTGLKVLIGSLEREIDRIKEEHELANKHMDNYLTNPVNSYRLIKRLHIDWSTYEERIRQDNVAANFLDRMEAHHYNLNFPSKDDVSGSAAALVRLQHTYQLDVKQVAAGMLNGIKYGNDMTWQDCYVLGLQLYVLRNYNETQMWLAESMRRLRQETHAKEPLALDFMESTADGLYHMGAFETALKLSKQVLEQDADRVRANSIITAVEKATKSGLWIKPPDDKIANEMDWYHHTQEFKVYEQLCRDELTPTAAQLRPLRCRYVTNNQPYRLLAPFKVEEHNLDPLVLTFYDMISDEKIDLIKNISKPLMKRSTVRVADQLVDYRISKNAWLKYEWHDCMQQMLRDLHDVTGLVMSHCEDLQVANYGLGGHYEPHNDFYTLDTEIPYYFANRLATAIYYLSDVEQGGATVFPFLRVSVKPRKGNVVFWYNLHRSLDGDYRTKHAGCPVLKGSKWIANIWIHDTPQTFVKPCGLHRDNEISLEYAVPK